MAEDEQRLQQVAPKREKRIRFADEPSERHTEGRSTEGVPVLEGDLRSIGRLVVVPPHLRRIHEEREAGRPVIHGRNRLPVFLLPIGFFGILGIAYLAATPDPHISSAANNTTTSVTDTSAAPTATVHKGPFHRVRYVARPELLYDAPATLVSSGSVNNTTASDGSKTSWAAHLPRRPIWCFFDSKDFTYTANSLPVELCSVVVFCCLDLSREGDSVYAVAADQERYKAIVERRKAYPWVRMFLGIGGPRAFEDGFRTLASPGVTNMTVVRLCRSVHKFLSRMGGEGVLFHAPPGTDGSYHRFILNLNDCLSAFDIEVSVVIPPDAIDDKAFFKYEAYYRHMKNVVVWAHVPNTSYATCPFDTAFFARWFEWLRSKPLSVANKSLLSLSMAPLRYPMPPENEGQDCFHRPSQNQPLKTHFSQVCLKVVDMTVEDPDNATSCRVYRDKRGCYLTFSTRAVNAIAEVVNRRFQNGLAVVDLNFDDYLGVCGERHRLFNALYNVIDAS